ncbi:MAG: hypothetical protein WC655_27515, partial [Candidatus Hydrogenedentales bacterium]
AIRVYSRGSLLIGFFSLFACGVLLDAFIGRFVAGRAHATSLTLVIGSTLLGFGIWDQVHTVAPPILAEWTTSEAEIRELQPFVDTVREAVPKEAAVFQLPLNTDYFTEPGQFWSTNCFTKLRPYLLSRDLRWSYAFPTYARKDALIAWEKKLMAMDIPGQIAEIQAKGFVGVYVDKREFKPGAYEDYLRMQPGNSVFESTSKRYLFVRFGNPQ